MKRGQCCSVTKTCPTLCRPMKCSTADFPVLHYLPGLVQVHVHWVSDVILPSHPLQSSSPPALNLSQHQGFFFCFVLFLFLPMSFLFTPIGISIRASASSLVPPMNIVDWLVGSPCSSRDSQKSSQAPQFKNMYSSMLSLVYGWTLTSVHDYRKNHSFD